jgi:hypothetical protein
MRVVRKSYSFICMGLWVLGLLAGIARADTFQLSDGKILSGDVVSFNENGLIVRLPDGKYSDRVPWGKFSQADLRRLAENPKIAPFAEPFIEVTQEERLKKTEVPIREVPRLSHPESRSLFGAMFSSGIGVFVILLLYAANIYAGYEVALFRAQPVALVCGVAAVLPIIGPIIFLSMPTRMERTQQEEIGEAAADAEPHIIPMAGSDAAAEPDAGGLRLAQTEAEAAAAALPKTQVFQRGAFTFNRRFFETKFPGFFGVVRRDGSDMVLVIKSARGQYVGERISRIASNDLHLQVRKGLASEEVAIPFTEIQEVQLKHKDA